jgi:hypothetical protein
VTYIPFLPWQLKMALLKAYLSRFYRKAGLLHMMPTCQSMDYTGDCSFFFEEMPHAIWRRPLLTCKVFLSYQVYQAGSCVLVYATV